MCYSKIYQQYFQLEKQSYTVLLSCIKYITNYKNYISKTKRIITNKCIHWTKTTNVLFKFIAIKPKHTIF